MLFMAARNAILQKHFEKNGFDNSFFEEYELSTSDKLQNIDKFCDMLYNIREANQEIVIYTDFDVDGIMSSIIACAGLSELGFNVDLFDPIPANGYGFGCADVDEICNRFPNASVILTGDVGISSNEAIAYAQSRGFTVLVTDHHDSNAECCADVAVNPNQLGETYSHNGICGSYVLYKVIEAFTVRYCSNGKRADIYRLQMFAGVATISDVMPLIYENRQLVRNSVSLMRYFYNYELNDDGTIAPPTYSENYMRAFTGMKKILEYFTRLRKIKKAADIDEQFYGFYLVPFLNSCKRMHGDMRGVYDIFFSPYIVPFDSFPNMSCVENGIKYVEALNNNRRELTSYYFDNLIVEKEENETDAAKYMQYGIYITDAPAGLLGLLGSKFINMTGLPTFVVNRNDDGSYTGSGRNPAWFGLTEHAFIYGLDMICKGHKDASFGVTFPTKKSLDDYCRFYDDVVQPEYEALQDSGKLKSTNISIAYKGCADCDFVYDSIQIKDFLYETEAYHPYGKAFPAPCFDYYIKLDPAQVEEKMFGSENQHVKLTTIDGMEIMLFNLALDLEKIKFDNKDKDFILVCNGTFHYDDYNSDIYDTVEFFANSLSVFYPV